MPARQGLNNNIFKAFELGKIEEGKILIAKTALDGRFPSHHLMKNLQERIHDSVQLSPKKLDNLYDSDSLAAKFSHPSSLNKGDQLDRPALETTSDISSVERNEYSCEENNPISLIFYVAMKGDLESVEMLTKQGYDILANDSYGNNIFHYLHLNPNGSEAISIFQFLRTRIYRILGEEEGKKKLIELLLQKNIRFKDRENLIIDKYALNPLELADIRVDIIKSSKSHYLCSSEIRDFLGVDFDPQSSFSFAGVKLDLKIKSNSIILDDGHIVESKKLSIRTISAYEIEKIAENPNPLLLEALIDYGIDICKYDPITKYTLLHHAAYVENETSVKLLLAKLQEKKKDVLLSQSKKILKGFNPLQIAIYQNNINIAWALISEFSDQEVSQIIKAESSHGDFKGSNALQISLHNGYEDIAINLIDRVPDILDLSLSEEHYNSLDLAVMLNRADVVNKIIQNLSNEALAELVAKKINLPSSKYYQCNLINIASSLDNPKILNLLLRSIKKNSLTRIINNLDKLVIDGKELMIKVIIDNLTPLDRMELIMHIRDYGGSRNDGLHTIHTAIIENQTDIAIMLLGNLSQANLLNILETKTLSANLKGYNSLHLAVINQNIKIIEFVFSKIHESERLKLIEERVENSVDYNGYNAIDAAILTNQEKVILALLKDLSSDKITKLLEKKIEQGAFAGANSLHLSAIKKLEKALFALINKLDWSGKKTLAKTIVNNPDSLYDRHNLIHILVQLEIYPVISAIFDDISYRDILDILRVRIDRGQYSGFNSLHFASRANRIETLKTVASYLTIEKKTKLLKERIPDTSHLYPGSGAIEIAIQRKRSDYIKILISGLSEQSRIELLSHKITYESLKGCNSLHLAAEAKNSVIFKDLIFGCEAQQQNNSLSYLQKDLIFQISEDGIYQNLNPFHIAIRSEEICVIDSFLQIFEAQDQLEIILHKAKEGRFAGLNLLHFAAIFGDQDSVIGLFSAIPEYKDAILASKSDQQGSKGFNAMHLAVRARNIKAIRALKTLGMDLGDLICNNEDKNLNGLNALQLAVLENNLDAIPLLVFEDNIYQIISNPESEFNGRSAYDIGTSPCKSVKMQNLLTQYHLQYQISPSQSPASSPQRTTNSNMSFSQIARNLYDFLGPKTP